jgi:hypothetical protein
MDQETPIAERRQNNRLRELFEKAYGRIAPFLDPAQTWGGAPLEFLALRMLREAHPELSSLEARQLVSASVRVYQARNPASAAQLPQRDAISLPK